MKSLLDSNAGVITPDLRFTVRRDQDVVGPNTVIHLGKRSSDVSTDNPIVDRA